MGFNSYMDKTEIAQDRIRKKIRLGIDNKGPAVEAEWVHEEMQASLKDRKKKNKKWRIATREGRPKEVLDRLEEEYKNQQKETSELTGKKMDDWEKKKIEEARKS